VTYVRVARDQRGYETTLLLHAARPGDRPRVLYWYRSAPGVRVGRSPLDEEAIRTIEEQYPDIEFDWPQLFEEASNMPPEAERRLERPRRKAPPPRDVAPQEAAPPEALPFDEELSESEPVVVLEQVLLEGEAITAERPRAVGNPLLDRLVGREIATRLRARRLMALDDFIAEHGEAGLRVLGGRRKAERFLAGQDPALEAPALVAALRREAARR